MAHDWQHRYLCWTLGPSAEHWSHYLLEFLC